MSKLKFVLPAAILLGIISFTSCTKKTTETTVVQDSIYYSPWIPLSMTMVGTDPNNGDTIYGQQISAPAVTARFISKWVLIGYYGYPNSATDTLVFDEAEFGSFAEISFTTGSIEVESEGQDLTYSNSNGYLFRYVLIPGNVLATTSLNGMTQQQLNKMSFTDIQKAIKSSQQTSGNTFNP